MKQTVLISDYLETNRGSYVPLIDVRSPSEFEKGHIPGAINIPLFNNEERALIGIRYKKEGKIPAILLGLELIGPNLSKIAKNVLENCQEKKVFVHCWRGGMRSASFAEMLVTLGYEVYILKGGYKQFRNWAIRQFSKPYKLKILGGYTGSGKTLILDELRNIGVQIIDLEKLAAHLGSVFGTLGHMIQPTQEQFENDLAINLWKMDPEKPIWLEDESRTLGKIGIPVGLWEQMRLAILFRIEIPVQRRIDNIERDYQSITPDFVLSCLEKITKRLGGLETQKAREAAESGNRSKVIEIMLSYYDRTYGKGQNTRLSERIKILSFGEESNKEIALDLSNLDTLELVVPIKEKEEEIWKK